MKTEELDYERWLAAVPAEHRDRVRAWVASCPPRGRRDFWSYARGKDVSAVASELVAAARARAPKCSMCDVGRSVAIDAGGFTYCAACVSPGAELVIDAR
jgi:hypothetical protein